jgi:hypothetical protein
VYDLFPRDTQGTNGIRLQYRSPGSSTYGDMSLVGDFSWGTPGHTYNFPTLIREGTAGQILAQPRGWIDFLDSALRVQVDAACARIRVQGAATYEADASYFIYKGATNWATPLWASSGGTGFDFEVVCEAGDELFFVVSTSDERGISTRWQNITLTGIPPELAAYHAVELSWLTASNRWYQIQYRTNAGSGDWLPLGTNVLGDGLDYFHFDTCRSNAQRFYRVIEIP